MRRESHVRFCEGGGVRFLSATRLAGDSGTLPLSGGERAPLRRPREGPFSARLLRRATMISDGKPPRDRGRRLRAESTDEERKLWKHLRAKRFAGFKFAGSTGVVLT